MKTMTMLLAAGALALSGGAALAAHDGYTAFHELYPYGAHGARLMPTSNGYRCRGISYGTGAQSCGTATGGPSGGLSSRN